MNANRTPTRTGTQGFPLIPGIAVGALVGSVALMVLIRFPEFILNAVIGSEPWGRAFGRLLTWLPAGAVTTPWAAVGGLVGGTLAWKELRAPSASEVRADSRRSFLPGEALVASALALMLLSFGLFPSVMTYLLALWFLPLAVALLLIGLIRARDRSASALRLSAGIGLFLLGMVALGAAALNGTNISYQLALPSYNAAHEIHRPAVPPPDLVQWARFVAISLIAASLIGGGLRLWTAWPRRRRMGWSIVILVFPVAALLLHRFLVAIGFLTLSA